MKLTFQLSYRTVWGENLHAVLYRARARANERKINIPLSTQDGQIWQGEIQLLLKEPLTLHYHYEVRSGRSTLRREWQAVPRTLEINPSAANYFLCDSWRDLPTESWLYSSAFTDVFRPRKHVYKTLPLFERTVILRAQTARPEPDETLFICGAPEMLGRWNPAKALPLTEGEHNEWSLALNAEQLRFPFEYKFIVKSKDGAVSWESGPNRTLDVPSLAAGDAWVKADLRPTFDWKTPFRAAGVVLPVFALRSQDGWGAGDFGDLEKLTDWAAQTGQKVIQILPINDTTLTHSWRDSYPYNAVSVYAFHPLYADARQLPPLDKKAEQQFEAQRKKINMLDQIDYEAATRLKLKRLRDAFKQHGEKTLASAEFKNFFGESAHWLPAYAMFCVLRDRYQTADFTAWPEHGSFSPQELKQFTAPTSPDISEINFWYYVQFILHTQLLKATRRAREKGVILKGDIPIGISPNSVEAWTEKAYFNLNAQAGAPPDDFSATGQNWGFPTYNWDVMAQDGYRWWRRRFTHMARYFDAYRIDHVLGFFRIWEIPAHSVQGLLGQFTPALPMNREEIQRYGLTFKEDFLKPYISEEYLTEKFGDLAEEAKQRFLIPAGNSRFALRREYDSQRKIESALEGKNDEKTNALRSGLYSLVSNVLFVPDRTDLNKFHPRISALSDGAFAALSATEKEAFVRLYNDYFFRRHNEFWKHEALQKLPPLIQSTRLLCCAEDLGMIPDSVPEVMQQLQMLSLEIERMPKRLGETFADTKHYPYLSVATPSTHDMSVIRGWWKESPEITQKFYNSVLEREGGAPAEADGKICEEIVRLHLESPSMLALLSFQDWTSMDEKLRRMDADGERINIPANPRHYWRYRMHITLEELKQADAFNDKVKRMTLESGR
ncbi:MAG: 4-alpha-glucanotransferase [Candidatus Avelusimicrobium sp.]|uniref:4-alpha-glucanotransferase n=1 Tax=Candidatus Avelusimicrobium sp. TaxID=3048833 RepID=UPI003F0770E4